MTKKEAALYLAQTIAEYIENRFPLTHLTGEGDSQGNPDPVHVQKLRDALLAMGPDFKRVAKELRV